MPPLREEFFANFTSPHTRACYRRDVAGFFAYLKEVHPEVVRPEQVERRHVVAWRNFLGETGGLEGRPAAPKTVARKLAALAGYFGFLAECGELPHNPVHSVRRPRREVLRPTRALTAQGVRQLFAAIDSSTPAGCLHRALLVMLFTTGMRKSEVLHLRFGDYREVDGRKVVEFRGKGGKVSQKLLHPVCVDALEDYLASMRRQGREQERQDWLFQPTRNPAGAGLLDRPLNPKTLNQILQKYALKSGLAVPISAHTARASFIGELLEAGVDIYTVAREVNHSSVKTTQEYDKRRKRLTDSPINKLPY